MKNFIETLSPYRTIHESSLTKCNLLWVAHCSMSSETEINNLARNAKHSLTFIVLGKFIEMITQNVSECNNILREKFSQTFTECEIIYLNEFSSCIIIFANGIKLLEKKSNYSVAYVLPVLFTIRENLKILSGKRLLYLKHAPLNLIQILEHNYAAFYNFSSEIHTFVLATCFFPKLKLTWLPNSQDMNMYNKVRDICLERVKEISSTMNTENLAEEEIQSNDNESEDNYFTFDKQWNTIEQNQKIELELLKYFSAPKSIDIADIKHSEVLKKVFLLSNSGVCVTTPIADILQKISFYQMFNCGHTNEIIEKIVVMRGFKSRNV